MLGSSSGSIALCCRVREPIVIAPRCQEETGPSAGVYAQSLTDYQQAVQTLAPHVPAHMINSPFPGERQTKFELLNGWQAQHDDGVRSAYKRARWFLRRPSEAATIGFAVRRPNGPSTMHGSIDALVNGIRTLTIRLMSVAPGTTSPYRYIMFRLARYSYARFTSMPTVQPSTKGYSRCVIESSNRRQAGGLSRRIIFVR